MTDGTAPVASPDTPSAGVQQPAEGVQQPDAKAATAADPNSFLDDGKQPDAKTDDKPAADAPKTDDKEAVYDLKLPEGMPSDAKATEEFVAFAKEAKLSPEAAQKIVDYEVKRQQGQAAAHAAEIQKWQAEIKADKDLGGEKLVESKALVMKALSLGTPEFQTFVKSSWMASHPGFFKFMHTVGKSLSEDKFVPSGQPNQRAGDAASRLYGTPATK